MRINSEEIVMHEAEHILAHMGIMALWRSIWRRHGQRIEGHLSREKAKKIDTGLLILCFIEQATMQTHAHHP